MKINTPMGINPPLANSGTADVNQRDCSFENWLQSPTRQSSGDEYYWQHQQHLQRSALTFNGIDGNKKTPPATLAAQSTNQVNESNRVVPDNMASALTPRASIPDNTVDENNTAPLHIDLETTDPIQQQGVATKNPCLQKAPSAKKSPATSTIIPKAPPQMDYKKHHLFIESDNIELSLNTQGMNREESHTLRQLIKQWLAKKGLRLTKLIINGEHP